MKTFLVRRALGLLAAVALFAGLHEATAQNVQHLSVPVLGGMPGTPLLTGIQRSTNGVLLTWDGPSGYYQVFTRLTLNDKWMPLGPATNLNRRAMAPAVDENAFFQIAGPAPHYIGAQACTECHSAIVNSELHTKHAAAFTNAAFKASGGQTNVSCLPCHTVGYGLPTGFTNLVKTPKLAGVQCESCHGPAANHAANPNDMTVRPRLEVAATVCGGCHTGAHQPAYDEWATSDHAQVTPEITSLLGNTNYLNQCGRCHSGTARLSLVQNKALPAGDALISVTCITCHDPHQTNGYPAQLRYPVSSTNDFSMATTSNFKTNYNATINVCGQCHNSRGASWTNNSPPHLSLQYNMLLGTVGDIETKLPHYKPASHATMISNQCVGCHMETATFQDDSHPAMTGHSFKIQQYNVCKNCHPFPEELATFAKEAMTNQISDVVFALNYWATNKAPAALAKYQERAWEYPSPGSLSAPGSAPTAAEQALIPENIRRARFNLYVVNNDGGSAIHNGPYSVTLLETALNWIADELDK